MSERREIKSLLGKSYLYRRYISEMEKSKIRNIVKKQNSEYVMSVLIAKNLKVEAVMICGSDPEKYFYDVFVKDDSDAKEWVFYESIESDGQCDEYKLFSILDAIVKADGLSYTECNFEVLNGKTKANR